ncbi:MAG: hypothetical protein H5U26_06005 [Immundisolibacter sp.]|uniref:hypothetical protein n=1 Tax=Immundisolibacter sp. TaxID=1934948 RepID=UPI0019BDCADF|nr:hypothetical protein [Immundisolibacter sp.]MBC7161639.1 hypothetical protein [Immundisolibacter sp.]
MRRAKDNRVVSVLVVLGIVVGAIGSFADSARKLASSVAEMVGIVQGPSRTELAAQAEARQAAQVVGRYYSRAIGQQVLDYRSPTREELRAIESALQRMLIALHAQKQPEKVKLAELAVQVVTKLRRDPSRVDYWQVAELQSQRDELASIFQALGVPLEAVGAPASDASTR